MATTEERLDAAIGKYEELFAKLMAVADYLARVEDCPYDHAHHDPDEKRRNARMVSVVYALSCKDECYGDNTEKCRECWRKWVLMAPADWWTV